MAKNSTHILPTGKWQTKGNHRISDLLVCVEMVLTGTPQQLPHPSINQMRQEACSHWSLDWCLQPPGFIVQILKMSNNDKYTGTQKYCSLCCVGFPWGHMKKHAFTPERSLTTNQRNDSTTVSLDELMSLLGLLPGRGCLKGSCITKKPTLTWVITQEICNSAVPCPVCRRFHLRVSAPATVRVSRTWSRDLAVSSCSKLPELISPRASGAFQVPFAHWFFENASICRKRLFSSEDQ